MKGTRATLAACLIVTVAACDSKPAPLTQQEKQIVTELTANLKTRCVGRYVIDMPGDSISSGYAKIQGVNFEATTMSRGAFEEEIAQREAELKATRSIDAYPFLYAAGEARGKGTRYFIHRGTVYEDPGSRYIEGYKWDRGYRIKLKVETYDYTNPDQTSDSIVKQFDVKNDVPGKTRLMFSLLEKVRGRTEDEIPNEPGVCFEGGFLPRHAGSGEAIRVFFAMKDKPDVNFELMTDPDARDQPKDTLPSRLPQIRSSIKEANGRIIRTGEVGLGGIKAQEVLMSAMTVARTQGHSFLLEVNAATSAAMTPSLTLSLYDIQKGTLTEGQAIALWDAVSRTLRTRPNGF